MYDLKKIRIYFNSSVLCIWFGTFSLLWIIFLHKIHDESAYKIVSYIIGAVFWLSLITGQVLFWLADTKRKRYIIDSNKLSESKNICKIGLLSFGVTSAGKITDIILLISVLVFIIFLFTGNNGNEMIALISVLFLVFQLHCLYNGRNYIFLKSYNKK